MTQVSNGERRRPSCRQCWSERIGKPEKGVHTCLKRGNYKRQKDKTIIDPDEWYAQVLAIRKRKTNPPINEIREAIENKYMEDYLNSREYSEI